MNPAYIMAMAIRYDRVGMVDHLNVQKKAILNDTYLEYAIDCDAIEIVSTYVGTDPDADDLIQWTKRAILGMARTTLSFLVDQIYRSLVNYSYNYDDLDELLYTTVTTFTKTLR